MSKPKCRCGSSMDFYPASRLTGRKAHWLCPFSNRLGVCRRPPPPVLAETDRRPNGFDKDRDYDAEAKDAKVMERYNR